MAISPPAAALTTVELLRGDRCRGNYVGETIDMAGYHNGQGGALTIADILTDLTTDSHGNAVVNFGNGDSITFEHISQSIVSAQAAHIFITHANVV